MKPTIAVIGIETDKGRKIVRSLARGNCRLLIYSNDLYTSHLFLKELISENKEIDAEILDCKVTATWEADIILAAVSEEKITQIANEIKDFACQKIIIIPDYLPIKNISSLLPYCKIVTVGENLGINGSDNEAVASVNDLLQSTV